MALCQLNFTNQKYLIKLRIFGELKIAWRYKAHKLLYSYYITYN